MSINPIKSPVTTLTAFNGGTMRFFDFIPREGPHGGRTIIDGFWLHAVGQCDVTVATIEGEDLARIFGLVTVEQVDGVKRWNLPGDASRIAVYGFEGAERYSEHADAAVANNQAFSVSMYIPMRKRFAHTPEDFALPADWFKEVAIQQPSAADLSVAGTFSLDTVDYYVIPELHEDMDVQQYNVDEVGITDFTTTTEATLALGGKLHDLYLHARGAAGGGALTNLTEARIDVLGVPTLKRTPDLIQLYRRSRNCGANLNATMGSEVRADPFANVKAVPLLMHDSETSAWDGKVVRTAKVNLTNTVTSMRAIHRQVVPASAEIRNRTNAAYGLKPSDYRVATEKKSRRDPMAWPVQLRPFLRLKAPLKRAG